jgi:type IV pilus assembly protein PilA
MLTSLRKRLQKDEDGFTLIELMVVVLIIAILIAIAIPTFLGAQDRARDRGAQSDLRNAITAAKTIAVDSAGLFQLDGTDIVPADLNAAEPSLEFAAAGTTDLIGVNVQLGGGAITLETESESGDVFGISATSDGQVSYCRGAAIGDCDDIPTFGASGDPVAPWTGSW